MIKVLWFLVVFKNKKPSDSNYLMVGKGGFEPPASCSRSMRAARLRYSPIKKALYTKDEIYSRPRKLKDKKINWFNFQPEVLLFFQAFQHHHFH